MEEVGLQREVGEKGSTAVFQQWEEEKEIKEGQKEG